MDKGGKRYRASQEIVDLERDYGVREGLKLIRGFKPAKFDETVEVALRLNIDPKRSDQALRGSVSLPHGLGKMKRVIAFVPDGAAADAAKEAGAIEAGGEELVKKVQDGWLEFDVAVAHPQTMRFVGRLGRMLGPKGLMPSPKSGTVAEDIAGAVKDFAAGKVEYRTDQTGNIHAPVGKVSFGDDALAENIESFIDHIKASRPSAVRGQFIKRLAITTTMGPSVRLNVG